jgi:hypothetical protein
MLETAPCPDCLEIVTPSGDGRCPFCGSDAVGRALAEVPRKRDPSRLHRGWSRWMPSLLVTALVLALVVRACAS